MSLLWTDGFDRFGAAADAALVYSGNPTSFQSAAGVNGGGCFRYTGTSGTTRTFATAGTLTAGNGAHASIWVKAPASISQAQTILQLNTNISNAPLVLNTDGSLSAIIHGAGTVLATSVAGVLGIANLSFYQVEYAAKFNTGANGGYIKVWINGNLVINFAGTTQTGTVPTSYTGVFFGKTLSGAGGQYDFDDLICWDEVGTDFAFAQLSTAYTPSITTLSPDGDDTVQFTPLSSTNASNVDDTAFHDGDTTYNSDGTVGHVDLLTLANPGVAPNTVFGVAQKTVWRIDAAGTVSARHGISSSGTVSESGDYALTTTYTLAWNGYGLDPNGSIAWTSTSINALKVRYKYQA